ncbi:aminopeptidase [Liquorilactobacillus mali]|uniref:Leucyl aminopeptidase n=1 Tax=Liquorilactobacillus mali TaxID=1618 RepID=A0A0R2FNS5_9LACO|nr:aminopeptidase [Liquorilactobacillus mali]KRN29806.1 hypothetical protein IV36_GL000352 [Liquorilactobacillus mali]
MSESIIETSKKILKNNLGVKSTENVLILSDEDKSELGKALYKAAKYLTDNPLYIEIPNSSRAGEEPPLIAAKAMELSDVVVCITKNSVTHTKAKENAVLAGARVATMPGITSEMFANGAITADYDEVEKLTDNLIEKLNDTKNVRIVKNGQQFTFSVENRVGIRSVGVYKNSGESGNLPSGEAYIAPVEGSANGTLIVDGSFVGVGKLKEPIKLIIENGRLLDIKGYCSKTILDILGPNLGRNVAEFGIGTNRAARLTGNILEDEKVAGTVHVAFGSNKTFGGETDAGVHLDGIILEPTFYLDDELIMKEGKFI